MNFKFKIGETTLDNTEAKVLELLFFYKINDIEEFEKEKNEIVKEYKLKFLK